MKSLIAYCGINCAECPAYIATQENDNAKRRQVAEEWQKMFNPNIKPEDINCDGCTSTGKLVFAFCNECKIRLCAIEKQVTNCAHCPSYACDQLKEFHKMMPNHKAQDNLESLRKKP
jgi:hypothetical protein